MVDVPTGLRPDHNRTVEVEAVATSLAKFKKEATVASVNPKGSTFTITCDEGSYLDGDDSAPPPLSYLVASVAF